MNQLVNVATNITINIIFMILYFRVFRLMELQRFFTKLPINFLFVFLILISMALSYMTSSFVMNIVNQLQSLIYF